MRKCFNKYPYCRCRNYPRSLRGNGMTTILTSNQREAPTGEYMWRTGRMQVQFMVQSCYPKLSCHIDRTAYYLVGMACTIKRTQKVLVFVYALSISSWQSKHVGKIVLDKARPQNCFIDLVTSHRIHPDTLECMHRVCSLDTLGFYRFGQRGRYSKSCRTSFTTVDHSTFSWSPSGRRSS